MKSSFGGVADILAEKYLQRRYTYNAEHHEEICCSPMSQKL
jgi:hypothetical protein